MFLEYIHTPLAPPKSYRTPSFTHLLAFSFWSSLLGLLVKSLFSIWLAKTLPHPVSCVLTSLAFLTSLSLPFPWLCRSVFVSYSDFRQLLLLLFEPWGSLEASPGLWCAFPRALLTLRHYLRSWVLHFGLVVIVWTIGTCICSWTYGPPFSQHLLLFSSVYVFSTSLKNTCL